MSYGPGAHARTPHGHVVKVLDMMTGAGFKDITYSGIPTDLIRKLQLPVDDPNRIK